MHSELTCHDVLSRLSRLSPLRRLRERVGKLPHDVVMIDYAPLRDKWRDEADLYERRGQTELAAMARSFAHDLEDFSRTYSLEALTLTEAGEESGYTPDHLSRMLSEDRLENVGTEHAPRIRRGDLPRKPPPKPTQAQRGEPSLVDKIRAAKVVTAGVT